MINITKVYSMSVFEVNQFKETKFFLNCNYEDTIVSELHIALVLK